MSYIYYVLIGVLGGVLGGMGMGGGTVLIPLLVLALDVAQKTAQTANVVSFIPMAIITLVIHYRNKLISTKNVLIIIIPAVCSCVVGCFIAKVIQTDLLIKLFGGFLALLSVYQIVCNSKKKTNYICANSTNEINKESIEKTIKKSNKM